MMDYFGRSLVRHQERIRPSLYFILGGRLLSAGTASVAGLFTLIGAVAGVAITGAFALATALINRRWARQDSIENSRKQNSRYIHESRKEACAAYVLNIAKIYQMLQDISTSSKGPTPKPATFRDAVAEGERIRAELILIASKPVLAAEADYRSAQQDLIGAVFDEGKFASILPVYISLLEVMRNDIQSLILILLQLHPISGASRTAERLACLSRGDCRFSPITDRENVPVRGRRKVYRFCGFKSGQVGRDYDAFAVYL
jgi:hypothetical protein